MSEPSDRQERPHGQPNNPLHGVTLKMILEDLVERRGWHDLSCQVRVNCFLFEPSFTSSLKFLRKVPWAREQVEQLYLSDQRRLARERERERKRAEGQGPT